MYVELNIPEAIPELQETLAMYHIGGTFGQQRSSDRQINALTITFMRTVASAISDFNTGSQAFRRVWANSTGLELGLYYEAITHFEHCIVDMLRAVRAYRMLRNHRSQDPIATALKAEAPAFKSDAVANRLKNARDAIQHLEEKIIKGEIGETEPIALAPAGPELPHPSEHDQTIKTFDRLHIGPYEITFRDLADWLGQMSASVVRIAKVQYTQPLVPR